MISYEKVKKGLQSSNLAIIILKVCSLLLSIIGIFMTLNAVKQLQNPEFQKNYSAEQLETVQKATQLTPFDWFTSAVLIILSILIIVFCFKNRAYLKNNQKVSALPYILGMISVIASVIISFLNSASKEIEMTTFSIVMTLIPALIMFALYIYSFLQTNKLNQKEDLEDSSLD